MYTLENDTHEIAVVEGNSLYDFLKESQALIQEGYEFDFETNEGFPQRIGLIYVSRMLRPKTDTNTPAVKKPRSKTA